MRLRLADVRPDERAVTFGAFLILFGLMAAHTLLETARDALFLARIAASRLPLVYLAIAGVAILVSLLRGKRRLRSDTRRSLATWLCGSALLTGLFWFLVGRTGSWIYYAIYIWSGVFSTIAVLQFWILMGDTFTVSQAKRVYALIGTGSILGAIMGSLFAQFVATNFETRALLLVASAILLGTATGPFFFGTRGDDSVTDTAEAFPGIAEGRRLLAHPYIRRLAILTLLSTISLTFADFIFKSVVQGEVMSSMSNAAIPSELAADRLGWVFATAYLVFNCLSLLAQLTIVGWMTRNLGVDRVLAFLPLLLLFSSLWLAVGGGILAALFLKGFDGTFRHSLHRTATEVLYVPLAGELRAAGKSIIDVLGQRGGQAVASLAIMALGEMHQHMPGQIDRSEVYLALGVAVLCGAWVGSARGLKRHYFDLFRETLRREDTHAKVDLPVLDLPSLEALMAALSRPDDREVVAALDLFAENKRVRLIPALILHHPSPRVVNRALELFAQEGRTDHHPLLERLLERPEGEVRQSALLHLPPSEKLLEHLERALADPSADVRATAIVGLHHRTPSPHPRVGSILDATLRSGSSDSKQALARAIRFCPSEKFDGILVLLANSRDPRVCHEVTLAMAAAPKPIYLRSLLSMLEWRESREGARTAFRKMGKPALAFLSKAMLDSTVPIRVRRHVPRTIARFDPQEAAQILLPRMLADTDGLLRYKALRALGRLRTDHPEIRLDESLLSRAVELDLGAAYRLLHWRVRLMATRPTPAAAIPPTHAYEYLLELLQREHENAVERLFRLFQLQFPREDLVRIYRGLHGGSRRASASARELLQHLLESPTREAMLALLEDLPEAVRLQNGSRAWGKVIVGDETRVGILTAILREGSTGLRGFAAIHAGETGTRELEADIRVLETGPDRLLSATIRRALVLLNQSSSTRTV